MSVSRSVTILGSTGSVGASTIDLVAAANRQSPESFRVVALTAQSNVQLLAEQAIAVGARHAAIGDPSLLEQLRQRLRGYEITAAAGSSAIVEAAQMPADVVMAAIVGTAGLRPTLAAVGQGRVVGLANKECLVTAGGYFMAQAAKYGAKILPVDSEHSAVFQVLSSDRSNIDMVTLTASGGPFRDWSLEQMARAGPKEACAHPNWTMGAKISVDSATLMNKGLEIVEASYLFGLAPSQLDVVVHRQSIVHALVTYGDGSVLAQLSHPDMRTPISLALAYPDRLRWPAKRLDLASIGTLSFEPPDFLRFRCLGLAMNALKLGGGRPTILNAVNEVAVERFLKGELPFLAIAELCHRVLSLFEATVQTEPDGLEALLALDAEARVRAIELLPLLARPHAVA